jgi:hypothetical protein
MLGAPSDQAIAFPRGMLRRRPAMATNMSQDADLYHRDFNAWIAEQAALLRAGRTEDVDVAHLIEELEDMGKSNLRELQSRLVILIAQLLKWQFQLHELSERGREFEGKSWRDTIIEQRAQIAALLDDAPSLRSTLPEAVHRAYPKARALALKQSGLADQALPRECPYTPDFVLSDDGFPGRS